MPRGLRLPPWNSIVQSNPYSIVAHPLSTLRGGFKLKWHQCRTVGPCVPCGNLSKFFLSASWRCPPTLMMTTLPPSLTPMTPMPTQPFELVLGWGGGACIDCITRSTPSLPLSNISFIMLSMVLKSDLQRRSRIEYLGGGGRDRRGDQRLCLLGLRHGRLSRRRRWRLILLVVAVLTHAACLSVCSSDHTSLLSGRQAFAQGSKPLDYPVRNLCPNSLMVRIRATANTYCTMESWSGLYS